MYIPAVSVETTGSSSGLDHMVATVGALWKRSYRLAMNLETRSSTLVSPLLPSFFEIAWMRLSEKYATLALTTVPDQSWNIW